MIVKSPDKLKNEWRSLEDKKDEFIATVKSLQEQIEEKKKLNNLIVSECREQEERIQKLHELLEMEKSIEYVSILYFPRMNFFCDCIIISVLVFYREMNTRLDSLKKKHAELVEEIDELKLTNTNFLQNIKTFKASLEELKARKLKQDAENKEALEAIEKYSMFHFFLFVIFFTILQI